MSKATSTTAVHTSWADALDQFEDQLDQARITIDSDEEPRLAPWPPRNIEPVPVPTPLQDRARALLHRCYELEDEIVKRRDVLAAERRRSTKLRRSSTRPHATFDAEL